MRFFRKNVAKMSLKGRKGKTLGRVRIRPCKISIWHSALKGGVVVAPQFSLFCIFHELSSKT